MTETKKFDFTGLGFCSNDYLSLLPEIPIDNKVRILEHLIQGGGPAATSTVAASRLGLKTAFISAAGDDDAGKRIIKDLEAEGVATEYMTVRKNSDSPVAYCWVDQATGKRSIAWTRGTTAELDPSEVNLDVVRNSKVLHLDGHNPKAAIEAAREARAHGVIVNFDAGTIRDFTDDIMKLSDILITSEMFARKWTGEQDLEKALFKLAKIGASVTAVTMGDQGSIAFDDGKIVRCPAFRIQPVDTTGAGDVFHAAFAVRYLETRDLYECMRFAAGVSALKCMKMGGRTGIPTRAELDRFLSQHNIA